MRGNSCPHDDVEVVQIHRFIDEHDTDEVWGHCLGLVSRDYDSKLGEYDQ